MARKIQFSEEYEHYEKVYVFANTGKERAKTLDFVHRCDKEWNLNIVWIEADIHQEKGVGTRFKIVDYKTANRTGEPFEASIKKYGIPSQFNPHCSKDLKTVPIYKFARSISSNYYMAIGFRIDEVKRINRVEAKKKRFVFPLVDVWPTWNIQVRRFWETMHFDLDLKDYQGNCDLCWKKSLRNRLTILSENPEIADWWSNQEENQSTGFLFDREGIPVQTLKEIATNQAFRRSIDKLDLLKLSPSLFDVKLDESMVCLCQNEND